MDEQYISDLYSWVSSKDGTFQDRYTIEDFTLKLQDGQYQSDLYSWISTKDPTFEERRSFEQWTDLVKKKDPTEVSVSPGEEEVTTLDTEEVETTTPLESSALPSPYKYQWDEGVFGGDTPATPLEPSALPPEKVTEEAFNPEGVSYNEAYADDVKGNVTASEKSQVRYLASYVYDDANFSLLLEKEKEDWMQRGEISWGIYDPNQDRTRETDSVALEYRTSSLENLPVYPCLTRK